MNVCENLFLLKILRLLYTGINVIRIVVPIGLVIKLSFDVYHHVVNPESKQIKELAVKRLIAAVIIFFLPVFVNLVMNLVEIGGANKPNYPACLSDISNIKYYENLIEEKKRLQDEARIAKEKEEYEKARQKQNQELLEKAQNQTVVEEQAIFIGQKYFLSDTELRGLCGVAKAEQGSIEGAMAEASLMANRYELLDKTDINSKKGLYNYVKTGGWFSNASKHMSARCPSDYLNAVRKVLVNGARTLPPYVNEHDCIKCGDILNITTNGVKYTSQADLMNHNNYVKDNTKVFTRYMDNWEYWIYYTFPASNSDPFGYTPSARLKIARMQGG